MIRTLPGSFFVFQTIGLWRPLHWISTWISIIYKVYTTIVLFLIYSFTITGIIELFRSHQDMEDLTNNCFMLISMVAVCGKSVNVVSCRRSIIQMLQILEKEPCVPRDYRETWIQNKCDRIIWINTLFYGILTEVTVLMLTLGTFLQDIPYGTLPFNAWLPYDYTRGCVYWFAYMQQLISVILSANTAIGYDTLVPGMIMQVSAKLNILKYRFTILNELIEASSINSASNSQNVKLQIEKKFVTDCVKCHLILLKLSKQINSTFGAVVFLQYTLSTIVLCVSVYDISHIELFSPEFTAVILYLCCMLVQIFIFCDAGNEVTLVSGSVADAIYEMNWTNLNSSTIKSLVIIMSRSLHPIVFTSAHLVTLSLDSFKSLIKVSYSTYNVLQQTSN